MSTPRDNWPDVDHLPPGAVIDRLPGTRRVRIRYADGRYG